MRVVAIADLHGRLPEIPDCDVLLLPGDVAPDFPYRQYFGDEALLRQLQTEWFKLDYAAWEKTVPAKEILMVPGNHDYVTKLPDGLRTKMFIDEGYQIHECTFWFTPWVSPCGDWMYCADRAQRRDKFALIPHKVDVLVAHSPALEVGDRAWGGAHVGCPELRAEIYRKQPHHVVFGHIHEGQRDGRSYRLGGSKLYHSTWYDETKPFTTFYL